MKRIRIIFSVIAMVALVWACMQKIEPTPQFHTSTTTFTASTTTTTVNPTINDSISNVVTISWNDPKYSAGLEKSNFTVYVCVTGNGFASALTKGFSGVLTGSLLGKEINSMAFKLGGMVGQTMSLDVKVIASVGSNNEQVSSNVLKITYSPYSDFSLSASSATKVLAPASATSPADTLTWGAAFKGYTGVKTYIMQYAAGGTNFATVATTAISGFSKIFTQSNLNNIAVGVGGKANTATPVDFRIVATDEQGNSVNSNVVTLTITPWAAYNSIGLIGDFTGWGNDVDLYIVLEVKKCVEWICKQAVLEGVFRIS